MFTTIIERGKTFMKRILTVLMAILLISTMLVSLAACGSDKDKDANGTEVSGTEVSETESEFVTDAAEYTESATPIAHNSAAVLDYFNGLVNGVKAQKPALSYRYEINVPNDIKVTKKGAEDAEEIDESLAAINDAAGGIKDLFLENIKEKSGDVPFGADNTEVLLVKGESWASKLTVDDIDYATIKEVGDYYYITIAFGDISEEESTDVLAKAFDLRDKEDVLASEEIAKTADYLKLNDYTVSYTDCKITARVNRLTNEVENINYRKNAVVVADMTGAGTLASYGDVSVIFNLEDVADYNMTWKTELPTSPLETATEA